MKIRYIKLYSIFTKKKQVYLTLFFTSLLRTAGETGLCEK
jgi:hypothetical protein